MEPALLTLHAIHTSSPPAKCDLSYLENPTMRKSSIDPIYCQSNTVHRSDPHLLPKDRSYFDVLKECMDTKHSKISEWYNSPVEKNEWKNALSKTRKATFGRIASLFGATDLTSEFWDELEMSMVSADLGIDLSIQIKEQLLNYLKLLWKIYWLSF